jgi:hypothetical protein
MDIGQLGRDLAKNGRLDKFKAMAESEDGRKLTAMLNTESIEKAAKSGDTEALKGILNQVLGTEEGRRLAQQISEAMR